MAQKLAPAEKNSTDISAASAAFCISGTAISHLKHEELTPKNIPRSAAASSCHLVPQVPVAGARLGDVRTKKDQK